MSVSTTNAITNNYKQLYVELYLGSQLWDRETIDVISDGENAIDYNILADSGQIKRNPNDHSVDTPSVTFSFYKWNGSARSNFNGAYFKYYIDGGSAVNRQCASGTNTFTVNASSNPAISSIAKSIKVELLDGSGGAVVESETVDVVVDGANGQPGEAGVSITKNKQWYILHSAGTTEPPKPIDDDTEPAEPATPSTREEWMSTPPEAVNGYVVWTCYGSVFSDDTPEKRHIEYSAPVKDNAYALAQGKTTNYYSPTEPVNKIKIGDCWFDTGYVKIATNPDKKTGYLGKFIISTDGNIPVNPDEPNADRYIPAKSSSTKLIKITPENINKINIEVGTTTAYETGNLKQWDGGKWKDIAGELVTNKLTANYINAMDITAKKITVLDKSNNNKPLFEADGINGAGTVKIGNFKVNPYGLIFGEDDSSRQFSLKNFTTQLQAYTYSQPVPNNNDINVTMKVTLTKDNAYFKFFIDSLCSYGIEANHCIIISNLNTNSAPTDPSSGEVYYTNNDNLYFTNYSDSDYTSHETIYGKVDSAMPIVFKNVKANDSFYITFRLNASLDPCYGHTISSQAIIYLPQNDTCVISDVQGRTS